jgi:hypothetical protein
VENQYRGPIQGICEEDQYGGPVRKIKAEEQCTEQFMKEKKDRTSS